MFDKEVVFVNEKKLTSHEREKISSIAMKFFKGEADYKTTIEEIKSNFNVESIRIAESGKVLIKLTDRCAETFEFSVSRKESSKKGR